MNLFTARLTGKMLSAEAFEKTIHDMQERVKRYRLIEKSPELAEYLKLKKIVESSEFQERKNELINRKYKDTDEGRKMSVWSLRAASVAIKKRLRILHSRLSCVSVKPMSLRRSRVSRSACVPARSVHTTCCTTLRTTKTT